MRATILAAVGIVCACAATPVGAHFIWVEVQPASDGQRAAHVWFNESPEPCPERLAKRLASAEIRAFVPGQPAIELAPKLQVNLETQAAAQVAPIENASAGRVEVDYLYGVFDHAEEPVLLHYYAKALTGRTSEEINAAAKAETLALDLAPACDGEKCTLTLTFQGKPVADAPVITLAADGSTEEFTTDAEGRVAVTLTPGERQAIRARHIEPDSAGKDGDKSYAARQHWVTLTMRAPGEPAAAVVTAAKAVPAKAGESSASDILEHAREARAVWDDFPGFRAKVVVHVDDERREGAIEIDSAGEYELKGIELSEPATAWVRQHLGSLIMHRMPGTPFGDNASYIDSQSNHVLGRRILLDEERMGSEYRVEGDVITEVNRTMGGSRFTISVIEVDRNEENKYLPTFFTISFWDNDTGALTLSETVRHRWQRVGKLDLPLSMSVVGSRKNERRMMQVDFSDFELLAPEATAGAAAR